MSVDKSNLSSEVADMVDAIGRYLRDHPQAADTLEGVVNWWLLRQRYENAMEVVNAALDVLVEQGVVAKLTLNGGETIYRLQEEHPGELKQS